MSPGDGRVRLVYVGRYRAQAVDENDRYPVPLHAPTIATVSTRYVTTTAGCGSAL